MNKIRTISMLKKRRGKNRQIIFKGDKSNSRKRKTQIKSGNAL